MKQQPHLIVTWEYDPTPDAAARIAAAVDLLCKTPVGVAHEVSPNLTENSVPGIMFHDSQGSPSSLLVPFQYLK